MTANNDTTSSSSPPTAPSGDVPAWSLTVIHHPDPEVVGRRAVLGETPLVMGRGSELFGAGALDDRKLSRRHLEVSVTADRPPRLRDLDSHNGTRVNDRPIREVALACWDVIEVGRMLLVVHAGPAVHAVARHPDIAGFSYEASRVIETVLQLAAHSMPLMFTGEPGTGKNLHARVTHQLSGRSGPLVELDAASATVADAEARWREAGSGSLYVDHVDDASPDLQLLLLRWIDDASAPEPVVRLLFSSLVSTETDLDSTLLRSDLVARLAARRIALPPLRDRRQDIPAIAEAIASRRAGEPRRLDLALCARLCRHHWSGNAHELAAVLDRLAIDEPRSSVLRATPSLDLYLPATVTVTTGRARIAADGAWFEVSGAPRVSLEKRVALRRILALLAAATREGAQGPTIDALFGAGWPGDRALAAAATNRVHVALTALRNLGLRDAIVRTERGYLLRDELVAIVGGD